MRARMLVAAALAGALVVPAAAASGASAARAPTLRAFTSCPSLLSYARANAARTGGTGGVETRALTPAPQVVATPPFGGDRATSQPVTAAPEAGVAPAPDFSSTNVQEVGVDEPDVVKTDGARLWAIADDTLRAVDVTGDQPRLLGALALEGSGHQLLVRGDRALVMATTFAAGSERPIPEPGVATPQSAAEGILLTEIDLSDPARMSVRRTLALDGRLVDARLTGATARVVASSSPEPVAESRAARAPLRAFVGRTTLRSRVSGRTYRRSVVPCDDVRRPARFSGLDLLTVLTIDLDRGLFSVDRDAIMAGAQTVYASATSLYVASRRYSPALEAGRSVPEGLRTEIHRFDASRPDATAYRSSGSVRGFVLNQYGLSEHEGALRVASTEEPQWFAQGDAEESESFVTVLQERGAALTEVGRAGGLGRGERIYAVRFIGDKGYVVTFRQVDPLYTLDLSDPTAPKVVGELKILGYSAYLHPVGEDRLLGVGQDAAETGRRKGTQVSLFDVSDLRAPKRVAQAALGSSSTSSAEFDPHAFLYWQPAGLAVIPLERFGEPLFAGAVGFRVGRSELGSAGSVEHPLAPDGSRPPIARSLVIGDRLYTLSYAGLASNRLDTLAPVATLAFAP